MIRRSLDLWLVALAAINLSAGVWLSFAKGGFSDLLAVTGWTRTWIDGGNPYGAHSATDYPPWALVELAPLGMIPTAWLPAIWVAFNLGLALWIASRLAAMSGEPRATARRLACLIAAAACLRTLAQFSHLSYAIALAGALAPATWVGGLLIGLSLIKPQVGGAALLWLIASREWRRAAIAVTVPVLLAVVFIVRLAANPLDLARRYAEILVSIQGSPDILPGHSDLRAWLWLAWPDAPAVLTVFLWAALLLPLALVMKNRRTLGHDESIELLALCGSISLLAVRHLSYDFVLLLPAVIAWRRAPFARRPHAPGWQFFGLAALLVIALPSWVRLAIGHGAPESLGVLTQLDRGMCLSVWAVLSWRLVARAGATRTAAL